jgi:hypothetical protein
MSYRLSSLTVGGVLVTLALYCLSVGIVQAAGRGRGKSIEFSAPKSDEVTTNLHQLTNKKDSLTQLEEEFSRSMRTLSRGSSLDGVPAPPVRPPSGPVIPSKRAKELFERHKNAFLLTPEDLVPTPTLEEIFKVPEYDSDGLEKKKKTAMEQYYERLDAKRAAALKPNQSDDDELFGTPGTSSRREDSTSDIEPTLPPGLKEKEQALKEKEQALKQFFQTEATDTLAAPTSTRRTSFSDIFGLGEIVPSREKTLEHKKRMEEFQSILESSRSPLPGAEGTSLLNDGLEPSSRAANPFGISDASSGANSQFGAVNPVFTPGGPSDVNEQVLGQSSLIPQVPKVEPTRPSPPTTFTAPRRPF